MKPVQKIGVALTVFVTIPVVIVALVASCGGGGSAEGPRLLWPEDIDRVKTLVEANNPKVDIDWKTSCSFWEEAGWDYDRLEDVVRSHGNSREVFFAVGDLLAFLWDKTAVGKKVQETEDDYEDDFALVREFCKSAA